MNIVAWSNVAPWASFRQIEQDLLISRAVIEIFSDAYLREELRFRGGTALNKLHFPKAVRYSEDIDLVRTTKGPIKALIRRLRATLEPWLDEAQFESSKVAPKLFFRVPAEDEGQLRLKVEIATFETEAFDEPLIVKHAADNPWFAGEAEIATYSREEMLATKLRALLQRDQGRDLFDLSHALSILDGLDLDRIIQLLFHYLELRELTISRAQADQRMFSKLAHAGFLADVKPLLSVEQADACTQETAGADQRARRALAHRRYRGVARLSRCIGPLVPEIERARAPGRVERSKVSILVAAISLGSSPERLAPAHRPAATPGKSDLRTSYGARTLAQFLDGWFVVVHNSRYR